VSRCKAKQGRSGNTALTEGSYSHGSTALEMCPKTEAKKIFLVTRRALLLSLSPLFYEDAQIVIFPAPISCLGDRYLRAAVDAFG
jgi:hypothetical protein